MANSQRNLDNSDDTNVEQFFDLEYYYGGACAEPDGILDLEVQAPNEPRLPGQHPRLELHQDQTISSEAVASTSPNKEMAMANVSFETVGEPSQPATHTGNVSLHQYEQPSGTDSPNAEMVHIDARIEEIDLILERRELQKRRHTILQNLPGPQQVEASERPGFQTLNTVRDSRIQLNSQGVTSDEASQGSDLFPTGNVPFNNNWVDHPRQNVPVDTDFRYGVAFADPPNFGFGNLSNNTHRGSSHFEVLGQSSKPGTELSNTGSVHLLNNIPARLPNSGPNHQCETQGPFPGLNSDRITMQSSLTDLQHKHGLNLDTVQHISAISSSQYHRALHNSERNMIIRKGLGSPQPTKVQHLSAIQRQLAKKTGVPETSLRVMCFNTEPPPKRRLTGSQKRNRKDVENVGGSCFLCLVFKKKCSGQRPCDTCRDYWQKRAHNSTSFMWTCDVQSKLSEIDIFSHSLDGIPESETLGMIYAQFGNVSAFIEKFAYLFNLIDSLEPFRAKLVLPKTSEDHLSMYTYTHSIVRWKRIFVYLIPELHRVLAVIEGLYRCLSYSILYFCDRMHRFPRDKHSVVMAGVLIFDEMQQLKKMEKSDTSAVDHVKLALKTRLKVLCSQIFNSDEDPSKKRDRLRLMMTIDRVPELSFCLPPAYRHYANIGEKPLQCFQPCYLTATPLDLPACLLRRSDSSEYYYDDGQIDNCCCGWAFDSSPPFFLSLFGHSARSFARYVHSGLRKITLEDEDLASGNCQATNTVLGGPWIDDSSLRKSMIVFGSFLSFLFRQIFKMIHHTTEEPKWNEEMAVIKDRLDRIAEHCRPRLFVHLLRSVGAMYHGCWNSDRESEAEAESSDEVWTQASVWLAEKHDSESDEFFGGVLKILKSTISAKRTESHDPDLSPDENSTQD